VKKNLWLIVRYMGGTSSEPHSELPDFEKENSFELRGGESLKLGRVIFTVTELQSPSTHYVRNEDPLSTPPAEPFSGYFKEESDVVDENDQTVQNQ
jgi:hypothetical protein